MPANLPACGLAPLVRMWLFLDLKLLTGFPPTDILAFTWKVRLTLEAHTVQIKRVFTRTLTLYLEKLVVVHPKRCCLLYWSLNVCQYCCMVLRFVLLILQSGSRSNLPLTESYVRYLASLLWLVIFFGLKPVEDIIFARQNRFVTRYVSSENSLCGLKSRKYCLPCFCSCIAVGLLFSLTVC